MVIFLAEINSRFTVKMHRAGLEPFAQWSVPEIANTRMLAEESRKVPRTENYILQ